MKRKHLLGLKDITAEEIEEILDTAAEMKKLLNQNVKKTPHLQGKNITTLFYENSTRTRVSFETAAKIMGANTFNISASSSSVQKGETLIDTGKTLEALLTDVVIIRHNKSGAAQHLSKNVRNMSVVNGGDGMNEHPTQALLDMLTMKEKFGSFKGLKVVIAGDVKHSRVARSNIWGLNKMGAEVTLAAPATLMPMEVESMGVKATNDLDSVLEGANVVMGLRVQLERQQAGLFPSIAEYHKYYGLTPARINRADPDAIVMHPGPINRGLELSSETADGESSYILEQVTNGVAVRMAVLFLLSRR
ncbi:MAG: aspartate carbamoyltransferase catalytic subunit [Clostridia bacterium]|nr:aspartate carbamoyltransferase catalytic subunit [Clostridia bacterium]